MNRRFFSYFWDSYFLSYGEFVELIKMHAMKLRVQTRGRRSRAASAEHCHWLDGRHENVVVSLRERPATTQVMLGVSLRARWDATLVIIIQIIAQFNATKNCCINKCIIVYSVWVNSPSQVMIVFNLNYLSHSCPVRDVIYV